MFLECVDEGELHTDAAVFATLVLRNLNVSVVVGFHLLEFRNVLLHVVLHAHGAQVSQLLVLADTGSLGHGDIAQLTILVNRLLIKVAVAAIVCHRAG